MSSKYQPPEFAHGRRSATVARVQGLRRSAVHASQRER